MDHSQEYYEQAAFKRLAEAYAEIVSGAVTEKYGAIVCPYCHSTNYDNKCSADGCPLAMMGIKLSGDATQIIQGEERTKRVSAYDKRSVYGRRERKMSGAACTSKPVDLDRTHTLKPVNKEVLPMILKAYSGIDYLNGRKHCPLCGEKLSMLCTKYPSGMNCKSQSNKCQNKKCDLHKSNATVFLYTDSNRETVQFPVIYKGKRYEVEEINRGADICIPTVTRMNKTKSTSYYNYRGIQFDTILGSRDRQRMVILVDALYDTLKDDVLVNLRSIADVKKVSMYIAVNQLAKVHCPKAVDAARILKKY